MRSPEVSIANRACGHTLLELLLVLALFSLVVAAIYPIGSSYYERVRFRQVEIGLSSALSTAALRAQTGYHDSAHGVAIRADSYVIYTGSSYTTREQAWDTVVALPKALVYSGPEEFSFSKFSGTPSATGTLHLQLGEMAATMVMNASGIID